jgi:hypothetical protein
MPYVSQNPGEPPHGFLTPPRMHFSFSFGYCCGFGFRIGFDFRFGFGFGELFSPQKTENPLNVILNHKSLSFNSLRLIDHREDKE